MAHRIILALFLFAIASLSFAQPGLPPATKPGGAAPIPAAQNVCPLVALQVRKEAGGQAPTGNSVGFAEPDQVVEHLLSFTGFNNKRRTSLTCDATIGDLSKMPFVLDVRKHFLSCWDGRHDYAIMGTPGGDIAEFLLGLAAIEALSPVSKAFTTEQVHTYLENYLTSMETFGKPFLYMHSDKASLRRWAQASKVSDPLHPTTESEVFAVERTFREGIGCDHLAAILDHGAEYQVRHSLAEALIKSFFRILRDTSNPLSKKLMFQVLEGYQGEEGAVVNILSPSVPADHCAFTSPLIVPRIDSENQIRVYHARAAYEVRAHLAKYFASRERMDTEGMLALFKTMNDIGGRQLHLSKKYVAENIPTYTAEFFI